MNEGIRAVMREQLSKAQSLLGRRPSVSAGLSAVIACIREAQRLHPNGVILIGIAGGSGSGKTSQVAQGIARAFPGIATIISMDDYFRSNRLLQSKGIVWDDPRAIDLDRLANDLHSLQNGESASIPVYDFNTGESERTQLVTPRPLIILEGLFTLHEPVYSLLDFSLYVDVDVHGQIIRRLLRDVKRGVLTPDMNLRYMAETVIPLHEQFVASTKSKANLVLDNEYRPETESTARRFDSTQEKVSGWPEPSALYEVQAEYVATAFQEDTYFEGVNNEFVTSNQIFRVRQEQERFTLTYKGPDLRGSGERFIFSCSLEAATVRALRKIYSEVIATVTKERRLYLLNGAIISLDRVAMAKSNRRVVENVLVTEIRRQVFKPAMGDDFSTIIHNLGLSGRPSTRASYQQLLHDPRDFQFVTDPPTR